jgi:hypothetical protein
VNPERILAAIPIVVAVVVGLLYAVGALLSAAKFRGAGLEIQDTVPLLPLETILATGIGTLMASVLLVAAWAGLGVAVFLVLPRLQRQEGSDFARVGLIAGLSALAVGVVLLATPVLTVTLALIALLLYLGLRAGRSIAFVFAGSYLLAVAGLVASAFAYPAPLPVAHVVPERGTSPITGDFVGEDDGVWYVADFATDEIHGYSLLRVDEASFTSRDREDRPTVLGVFH